ncbi:MAG: hypothetical protein M3Y87_24775 [Myxococcota bacterium]|nr:hypothetical protein [Myxococcota bacterium]
MRTLVTTSAIFLAGCFTESPDVLQDTLGVAVGWECDGGECEVSLRRVTADPPVCAADDRWVVGAGAVAILCAASEEGGELAVHESTCRPIACDDELDCPQWDDLSYGCDVGICTTSFFDLDPLDVRAACLRLVPRRETCEAQDADADTIARTAIAAAACPDGAPGCAIPEECRP